MKGWGCNFSISPVPILEPPVLSNVCHGKPLLPAEDSMTNLVEKMTFIEADLPRPPLDMPSLPTSLFYMSGHLPKHLPHPGPFSPPWSS